MKNIRIELKWAIIFVLFTLLWMLGERLSGLHDIHIDKHPIVSNFIAIPAIAIYVFALLDKRKRYYAGKMTYKQGFICGLIITLFVTIISPLTQYIISEIISPQYFANAIEYSVKNNKMTQSAAEDYFNLKNYIIEVLTFTPIMGIITTAIVALFTKKK